MAEGDPESPHHRRSMGHGNGADGSGVVLEETARPVGSMIDVGDDGGPRFGPYLLLRPLGKGGMGTVYLAQQEEPIRRRVALKVIDSLHERLHRDRFAVECQALARLGHPNVAALYEVGATDDGSPFVVMEWIEGSPITEWCDQHRLDLSQRIELFLDVCAGLGHAHEKGILHRDIKPTNVMVTRIDGRPVAKLIDFGLARSFGVDREEARLTKANQVMGSLHYLSPEAMGGGQVDTRSDVYALGLLLYELVVGCLPFDTEQASFPDLVRRLMQGDYPPPSRRLGELETDRLAELGDIRGLDSRSFERSLSGDLDAIVGKAMALERARRFASPAELADDLRRHLENRPVESRAPTAAYLLRRYVRRNRTLVVAFLALALSLVAGTGISLREARRANLEAERATLAAQQMGEEARRAREALAEARELSDFLTDLFGLADPERAPEEPIGVLELLDRGAERLEHELVDQPLARARLLTKISDIYAKLGRMEAAMETAKTAVDLQQGRLPDGHADLLRAFNQLGIAQRRLGHLDAAEISLRRVLEARRADPRGQWAELANAWNNLGNLLWNQERYEQALEAHQNALHLREQYPTTGDDLASSLNNLAVLLQDLGRHADASPYLHRAERLLAETLGPDHSLRGAVLGNLGILDWRLARWQEAEEHLAEAVRICRATYGEDHPRTLQFTYERARVLDHLDRSDEAVGLLRSALGTASASQRVEARRIASLRRFLGIVLAGQGELDKAEEAFRENLELVRETDGAETRYVLLAQSNLAWIDLLAGRFREAEAEHRRVLEHALWQQPEQGLLRSSTLHFLGQALLGQARPAEAEAMLREASKLQETFRQVPHWKIGRILTDLSESLEQQGKTTEALAAAKRAAEILERTLPPSHRELRKVEAMLAALDSPGRPAAHGPPGSG